MPSNEPIFEVYKIKKGETWGILFRKRVRGRWQHAYFYDESRGLQPNGQICRLCPAAHHGVRSVRRNGDPSLEALVLDELAAYAETSEYAGNWTAKRPILKAHHYMKGFSDVLGRCLEVGDARLREFLETKELFRDRILDILHGNKEVEGRAQRFAVLPPEQVMFGQFSLLQHARDVLKIGSSIDPVWFRKDGPIMADFDAGFVYRRSPELRRIERQLQQAPFFLIEGDAASGKSVLVRQYAYETLNRRSVPVFYFRDALADPLALSREIKDASGVVIIEDVHRNPRALQRLVARLEPDPPCSVLLTARPSYRESQDSEWTPLDRLPRLQLDPFVAYWPIVEHFLGRGTSSIKRLLRSLRSVRDETGPDLWHLSYALRGFQNGNGRGSPADWIREGVSDDLRNLEAQNPIYPRALVVLGGLGQEGLPTHADYLHERFEVDRSALLDLARRGEVRELLFDGESYWTLPHAALARAYWRYGQRFIPNRDLRKHSSFLTDYVEHGLPDALPVISDTDRETAGPMLESLRRSGKLFQLATQAAPGAIIDFARSIDTRSREATDLIVQIRDHLCRMRSSCLLTQLFLGTRPEHAAIFADSWELIEPELRKYLHEPRDILEACQIISDLAWRAQAVPAGFWAGISPKGIVHELRASEDPRVSAQCLCLLARIGDKIGDPSWRSLATAEARLRLSLDQTPAIVLAFWRIAVANDFALAHAAIPAEDPSKFLTLIETTNHLEHIKELLILASSLWTDWDVRIWSQLNHLRLVKIVFEQSSPILIGEFLSNPFRSLRRESIKSFLDLVDPAYLAIRISSSNDPEGAAYVLWWLQRLYPDLAQSVASEVNHGALGTQLQGVDDAKCLARSLLFLSHVGNAWLRKVLEAADPRELAALLDCDPNPWGVFECLHQLCLGDETVADEICQHMGLPRLAARLQVANGSGLGTKMDWLKLIASGSRSIFAKLFANLDLESLADEFTNDGGRVDLIRLLADVTGESRDRFIRGLNPQKLGEMLSVSSSPNRTRATLEGLAHLDPQLAAKVCGYFQLFARPIKSHLEEDGAWGMLIGCVCRIDSESARRILDPQTIRNVAREIEDAPFLLADLLPDIILVEPSIASAIFNDLNTDRVAQGLGTYENANVVVKALRTLLKLGEKEARAVWNALGDDFKRRWMNSPGDLDCAATALQESRSLPSEWVSELVGLAQPPTLARALFGKRAGTRKRYVQALVQLAPSVTRQLCVELEALKSKAAKRNS